MGRMREGFGTRFMTRLHISSPSLSVTRISVDIWRGREREKKSFLESSRLASLATFSLSLSFILSASFHFVEGKEGREIRMENAPERIASAEYSLFSWFAVLILVLSSLPLTSLSRSPNIASSVSLASPTHSCSLSHITSHHISLLSLYIQHPTCSPSLLLHPHLYSSLSLSLFLHQRRKRKKKTLSTLFYQWKDTLLLITLPLIFSHPFHFLH